MNQRPRNAEEDHPSDRIHRKLSAIRAAARHDFPTADVDKMLAEIAAGYRRAPD